MLQIFDFSVIVIIKKIIITGYFDFMRSFHILKFRQRNDVLIVVFFDFLDFFYMLKQMLFDE